MIITIAIIGKDNVGKSSIFNILAHNNLSIISNKPHFTKDRKYYTVKDKDLNYKIIDTAGIQESLVDDINIQTMIAIKSANLIYFVVDANVGFQENDQDIAKILRTINKKTYLIINKTDNTQLFYSSMDFYKLGYKNLYHISTKTKYGIKNLITKTKNIVLENLKESQCNNVLKETEPESNNLTCMLLGRPNVGKSTFINAILNDNRVLVSNIPGTTTDSINIKFKYKNNFYLFLDTAGIRKESKILKNSIEKISVSTTISHIKNIDIAIIIIDAKDGLVSQDIKLLNLAYTSGQSIIIIVNKCDLITQEYKKNLESLIYEKLNLLNKKIDLILISSKNFNIKYKNLIFLSLDKIISSKNLNFTTHNITNMLNKAIDLHPIPNAIKFKIKFKYAHLGCNKPIKIIMHGKNLQKIPQHYFQYLKNYFIKNLNLVGTNIIFKINKEE